MNTMSITWFLVFVIVAQFIVILKLMHDNPHHQTAVDNKRSYKEVLSRTAITSTPTVSPTDNALSSMNTNRTGKTVVPLRQVTSAYASLHSPNMAQEVYGVAVTVFMGSPKWFQNRYSIMINQILVSLSPGWKVQIFYADKKMAVEGTQYPGIQKHVNTGRVVLTPLPKTFKGIKKKDLMLQPWFWKSMLSDTVLIFGGSTAICANSPHTVEDFLKFDFLGGPWSAVRGVGGDGALSVRNRTLMVRALETYILDPSAASSSSSSSLTSSAAASSPIISHHPPSTILRKPKAVHANKREEIVFIEALQSIQNTPPAPARIASMADTRRFVSSDDWWGRGALGAVGTMGGLNHTARQQVLDYCPELKMLFPVLHYPDCFGSEPNPLMCIKALCENGGIRCAEELIKRHKEATKNGKLSAGKAEPTIISLDWLNGKRNIKVKLSLEYMMS